MEPGVKYYYIHSTSEQQSQAAVTLAKNMTEPRKIPSLDIKLSGPSTYSEWVVSIETYLDLIPVDRTEEYRVLDIIYIHQHQLLVKVQ
jgi:hypothetical protein